MLPFKIEFIVDLYVNLLDLYLPFCYKRKHSISTRKGFLPKMEVIEKKFLPQTPFLSAAVILADLCNKIDESSDEIDSDILAQFDTATTCLEESIDRRKFVIREAESKIELARAYKRSIDETIKRLQKVQDRITESTKVMVGLNPNIPFKDTLGNKLTVRKNSQAHLVLALDLREAKSVSNILDDASISLLGIDEKYIKQVSYTTLNTEKVKTDLATGIAIPWAALHFGTHLRGLK